MARFGDWKPLATNWAAQQRMAQVDIISIHTCVGSLTGTDGMFRRNGYGGTFSHFGVGGYGECTQWQDTAYRGAANYNGNWHIVSVECADVGAPFPAWDLNDGNAVPAFTAAQVETLAQLCAAMCKAHNIPCVLIPDAKPGRRGIGYHRLGVPGYMVAGAEQWSNVNKKACPGDRRIAQIPAIVARARQILTPPAAAAQPTITPVPEDDMQLDEPIDEANPYVIAANGGKRPVTTIRNLLMDTQANAAYAARQTAGVASALEAMTRLVAAQNGLTLDDVRKAVADEIAKGVAVDVTVAGRS